MLIGLHAFACPLPPCIGWQHDQLLALIQIQFQKRISRRIKPLKAQAQSTWNGGGIALFSKLYIGHADFLGEQFGNCKPFRSISSEIRMECVFFNKPRPFYDAQAVRRRRHSDFDLSLDNVWYCSVALLFKMTVRTDNTELQDVECSLIDVFFDYAQGRWP
jgi:hypothetical protein